MESTGVMSASTIAMLYFGKIGRRGARWAMTLKAMNLLVVATQSPPLRAGPVTLAPNCTLCLVLEPSSVRYIYNIAGQQKETASSGSAY
ncbi:hypothetical protein EXIGLDRAFT_504729 [Exidia glandulosa HHB12029]|uniref:Uncharacterized protein n=1 Tax=Exidia glandulosa HHB12029 TaxID=1314781 RepID=A0A165JA89_EXIGL|nr:hypothetical protein EXIGLDRAFT_504729 [Exidia glandulosa HHB12029]